MKPKIEEQFPTAVVERNGDNLRIVALCLSEEHGREIVDAFKLAAGPMSFLQYSPQPIEKALRLLNEKK